MYRTVRTSLPWRLVTASAIVCCWLSSSVARGEEELKVAHILLRSQADAEAVRKQIDENGGDAAAFKKACYARSLDAGTKPLGGVLPTPVRRNGQYDKAFTAGAFLLKEGEISQPVKSEFGWHLIQVLQRRDKGAPKKTTEGGPELGTDGLPTNPVLRAQDARIVKNVMESQ